MPVGLEVLSRGHSILPTTGQLTPSVSLTPPGKKRLRQSASCKEPRKARQKLLHLANAEVSAARRAAEKVIGDGEGLGNEEPPERSGNRRERRRKTWLEEKDRLPDRLRLALFQATTTTVARMDVRNLPHTHPSWIGTSTTTDKDMNSFRPTRSAPAPALDPYCNTMVRNLVQNENWTYIANQDRYNHFNLNSCELCLIHFNFSRAQALVDKNNLVFILKARTPKNGWDRIVDGTEKALEAFASSINLEMASLHAHKRGDFPSFTFGNSHGGGQEVSATNILELIELKDNSGTQPPSNSKKEPPGSFGHLRSEQVGKKVYLFHCV